MSQMPAKRDNARLAHNALKHHKDSLLSLSGDAIAEMRRLLKSKSDRVRLDAAKAICDRAGLLPGRDSDTRLDANLAEVPVAQLRRIADRLESEIADRAKLIEAKPADYAEQVIEIKDN